MNLLEIFTEARLWVSLFAYKVSNQLLFGSLLEGFTGEGELKKIRGLARAQLRNCRSKIVKTL